MYASHDKTLRNQGSWSLAGIWSHSWSATACDMRDRSNIFACLQDFFLTGAADKLLIQPSLRVWDQTTTGLECQMTEEGGFAHTARTRSILVNEWPGPALLQNKIMNIWFTVTVGLGGQKAWASQQVCPGTSSTSSPGTSTILNHNAKCCSWDWKFAVALDCFMCPKCAYSDMND